VKARRIQWAGEEWVSQNDLRAAMNDDQLVLDAAAMLKVAHEKGDDPVETIRKCLAYFYTEATGALTHEED
jgi:hypothetical protein